MNILLFHNSVDRNITIGYDPGFYSTLKDENWANDNLFNNSYDRNIIIGYDPGFYSTLSDANWANDDLFNIRFKIQVLQILSLLNKNQLQKLVY